MAELPESEIWASALTSAVRYPLVQAMSSRDCQAHLQRQPCSLWGHNSRLQALLQPPVFPHSNSFSGCPRRMLMPETRFWGRFIEQGRLLHHYNHLTSSGSIPRFGKPGSCGPAWLFFKILSPLNFLKMSTPRMVLICLHSLKPS